MAVVTMTHSYRDFDIYWSYCFVKENLRLFLILNSIINNHYEKGWNPHFSLGPSFPISVFSPKNKNKQRKSLKQKALKLPHHFTTFVCQIQKPLLFSSLRAAFNCTIYSFIKCSYSLLPGIYITSLAVTPQSSLLDPAMSD